MRTLKITVNDIPYEVEVGDLSSSPVDVIVNGKAYSVAMEAGDVVAATPIVTQAAPVVTPRPAQTAAAPKPQTVVNAGPVENQIRVPMPGTILDVMVKAGDSVKAGQQICALEAMKMKSAVRSNRDGKIAAVYVTNGQKVSHGDPIVTFE
ncbi:MAG: biotin/lipoyl-containing protein [Anaerolineaceae bacterium]